MNLGEQTEGAKVEKEELIFDKPQKTLETGREVATSQEKEGGKWPHLLQSVGTFVEILREDIPFTFLLLGNVGFIIIASFGHLNTSGNYSRYVIFLLTTVVIYGILKRRRSIFLYIKSCNRNFWIFKITYITLLLLVIYGYKDVIFPLIQTFLNIFK